MSTDPGITLVPVITHYGQRSALHITDPISREVLEALPPRTRVALLSYGSNVVLHLVKPSLDGEPWPLVNAYPWPRAEVEAMLPEGVTLPDTGIVVAMDLSTDEEVPA